MLLASKYALVCTCMHFWVVSHGSLVAGGELWLVGLWVGHSQQDVQEVGVTPGLLLKQVR